MAFCAPSSEVATSLEAAPWSSSLPRFSMSVAVALRQVCSWAGGHFQRTTPATGSILRTTHGPQRGRHVGLDAAQPGSSSPPLPPAARRLPAAAPFPPRPRGGACWLAGSFVRGWRASTDIARSVAERPRHRPGPARPPRQGAASARPLEEAAEEEEQLLGCI